MAAAQLGLDLPPQEPYSLAYLVPHRGIVPAIELLQDAIAEISGDAAAFRSLYLWGPSGTGKTHLARAYFKAARAAGISSERILLLEMGGGPLAEERVPELVAESERIKGSGGLLIFTGGCSPHQMTRNEHALSRLLAGGLAELRYPGEDELRPLLASLSERRNLRLSERNLNYLIRRLPLNPLSFDAIFATIDQLCIAHGKPARLGIIREVVQSEKE